MRRINTTALAALLVLGLAACDQEVMGATSGRSRMQVGVRGDDSSGSASASRSSGARYSLSGGGSASGTVEVKARVWVETDAGEWVELTNGAETETVQASGSDGVQVLTTAEVEAESYHRVRVEFERVEASLIGNISIGGSLLNGSLSVDAGSDGKIVVEREVDLDARAGATQHLEINLNASEWMEHADAETRAVAEAEFRSAVAIVAE